MGDDSARKVYVGGLDFNTSAESIKDHFFHYGNVLDCNIMIDKETGRSRGFAFVTFEEVRAAEAALATTSHTVDGRSVSVRKAVRDAAGKGSGSGGAAGQFNAIKIFVGGLPPTADYDKLTSFFGQFGNIEDAVVMMDPGTQRSRGFGFVTYSDTASVEAAVANYDKNEVDGKWVEVKRCVPQDKMGSGGQSNGKGKGGSKSQSGSSAPPAGGAPPGYPSYPGYGAYPGYGYPGYGAPGAYGAYPGYYGAPGYQYPPGYAYPPGYGAYPTPTSAPPRSEPY